jgi:hypothetical protein
MESIYLMEEEPVENLTQTADAPDDDIVVAIAKATAALKNGANWYYWIAGLSVVNSAIQFFEGQWSFIVGLGVTQVIDGISAAVAEEAGGSTAMAIRGVALVLDLCVAGLFVLFGWLANHRKGWAFAIGMVLYAADALIFVLVQDWLSIGFHGFALFGLFGGYAALKKLRELERSLPGAPIEPIAA